MMTQEKILKEPYTIEEIENLQDGEGRIYGVIEVDTCDVIGVSIEDVDDILSEKLIGTTLLADIDYHVVGHCYDLLFLEVSGYVVDFLEFVREN